MADYVLVHGAWCGAWCYEQLADELRGAGHRVVAVDLPGLGADAARFHPGITLGDHIAHVEAEVARAGFDRFVLVGHSYGGMVITGAAARLGARIDRWSMSMPSCPAMASRCGI
ncbi:alpha/beta fold hydrolase [Novosphingobium pokkalii]|uniref:alpha/beta fold hydrolase n=1 Tax=Novosphingobium pokkalii TaxID=1770194 RepID=UPI00363C5102